MIIASPGASALEAAAALAKVQHHAAAVVVRKNNFVEGNAADREQHEEEDQSTASSASSSNQRQHRSSTREVEEDDDESSESHHHDDEEDDDDDDRITKNRARNREHARKTRLRKKAQLEGYQQKVQDLQREKHRLQASLQEWSTASILVGLLHQEELPSSSLSMIDDKLWNETTSSSTLLVQEGKEHADVALTTTGKRKRFVSVGSSAESEGEHQKHPQVLRTKVDGQTLIVGGKDTHINWKSGRYTDQQGHERLLSEKELKALRKERNRIHAKMTRDRKKNFIHTMQTTIEDLEATNRQLQETLSSLTKTMVLPPRPALASFNSSSPSSPLPAGTVTPPSEPASSFHYADDDDDLSESDNEEEQVPTRPAMRSCTANRQAYFKKQRTTR